MSKDEYRRDYSEANFNSGLKFVFSDKEDIVASKFNIHVHHPLKNLSNEFAKYYVATHLDTNEEHYAIVFERTFSPNYELINAISASSENIFIKPIAASYTKLSNTKIFHLVIIVKKFNPDANLLNYSRNNELNVKLITNKIIGFLSKALSFAQKNKFDIGNINPKNILFDGENILIREPYITLPHFHQEACYLAIELLDCHPAARFTGKILADIYAIGMTILEIDNKNLKLPDNQIALKGERFKASSYYAIVSRSKVKDGLKFFIKHTMDDNADRRWNLKQIEDFSVGNNPDANIQLHGETSPPISFNGANYSSFISLASALFNEWEIAQSFIQEERLLKWVQRLVPKHSSMEYIYELLTKENAVSKFVSKIIDRDEKLFRIIQALDMHGPMRYQGIGIFLNSIPSIYLYALLNGENKVVDAVIKIILRKRWEDLYKIDENIDLNDEYIMLLESINSYYDPKISTCSVHRVLYTLNPDLPCLSPIVISNYVQTLEDIIILLDNIAETHPDKLVFDDHILGFIAEKASLKKEHYVRLLNGISHLTRNATSNALVLLAIISQKNLRIKTVNLAIYFQKYLIDIISRVINNRKIKDSLTDQIKIAAKEGNFNKMLSVINSNAIFNADQIGFEKATSDIKKLEDKIKMLSNNDRVYTYGNLFGQRLTVLLSYILLIIITFFIMV